MFTGLIEEVGGVLWIRATDRGTQLQIAAPQISARIRKGDSVAVNGCCLTVGALRGEQLTFDLLEETLNCTNLKALRRDSPVNLELAVPAGGRMGGHFVQGHIDRAAPLLSIEEKDADVRIEIELPSEFAHFVAHKGSIAINGISLTIAEVNPTSFAVWVIPHTRRHTTLGSAQAGDLMNLEFDLLAKYVQRMLDRYIIHE